MNKNKDRLGLNRGQAWLKGSAIVIMAVLFAVLFFLWLHAFDYYSDAGFVYSFAGKAERIFLALLSLAFFCQLYYAAGFLTEHCSKKGIRIIRLVLFLLFIGLQCFFLFYIRSYYKWDSGFVLGAAASLAEQGKVADEAFYYLSVYPNQNAFVCLTAFLIKLSNLLGLPVSARPLLLNVVNTVLMDLAILLLLSFLKTFHKVSAFGKRIRTEEEVERILCRERILLFCNPFFYLGTSYYYTITLSLVFVMGFIVLIFKNTDKEAASTEAKAKGTAWNVWIRWIAAGILLGIAYEIRATAIIFAVAALIYAVYHMVFFATKTERGKIAGCIVITALPFLLTVGVLSVSMRSYIGIDTTDTAFPTTHWLMMSLTEPGGHNAEDEAYTASFATKEEKKAAVRERMVQKLHDMGLQGYAKLVKTKICRTFGDGMNGYTTFLADGYGTGEAYDALFGNHKDFTVLWHQGYYLFIMLGILISCIRMIQQLLKPLDSGKGCFLKLLFMLVSLFGAILFYVLWEASEQYSVPFMLIMLFLGLVGMQTADDLRKEAVSEAAEKRISQGLMYGSLGAALLLGIWSICRYRTFTVTPVEQSRTAAVQIMANEPYEVKDGEALIQDLTLHESCNHLVMQWRNPLGADNDSVYEVTLKSRDGSHIYMQEQITASQSDYNGAGIYDFETVKPAIASRIEIRKISGSAECNLQFVLYDMYGYTPYPGGDLRLANGAGETKLQASLLFLLTNELQAPYITSAKYIFFMTCLFLYFLFMGICCKLERTGWPQRLRGRR